MPYHLATPAHDSILPFREFRVKPLGIRRRGIQKPQFHHAQAIY